MSRTETNQAIKTRQGTSGASSVICAAQPDGSCHNNIITQRPIITDTFPSTFPAQKSTDYQTKKCSTCNLVKSHHQFYQDKRHLDGLQSSCKSCVKLAQNKKRNTKEGKTKLQLYHQTESFRTNLQHYHKSEKGKQARLNAQRNQHKLHPEAIRCRWLFQTAIKRGKIIRPQICEGCDKKRKPDGHHEDYSKPYEVKWLCDRCHRLRHGKKSREILHPDQISLQKQAETLKDWFGNFDGVADKEVSCSTFSER